MSLGYLFYFSRDLKYIKFSSIIGNLCSSNVSHFLSNPPNRKDKYRFSFSIDLIIFFQQNWQQYSETNKDLPSATHVRHQRFGSSKYVHFALFILQRGNKRPMFFGFIFVFPYILILKIIIFILFSFYYQKLQYF